VKSEELFEMPLHLHVENWRCIERLDLELSKVNVFIGPNSSGKSSLAHVIYLLAKAPRVKSIKDLIKRLYGLDVDYVVRRGCNGPCYPAVIRATWSNKEAELRIETPESITINGALWSSAYLLSSQRVDLFKLYQSITSIVLSKELSKESHETTKYITERSAISFIYSLILAFLGAFHPATSLFFEELMSLKELYHIGKIIESKDVGSLIYEAIPLILARDHKYIDPYISVELPANAAPDGIVDVGLIEEFSTRAESDSLMVIEEPENYKHPVKLIETINKMINVVLEKKLTLILTTHNDLVLHAIAKAVEKKQLKPGDVAIYYLERGADKPWTNARRIAIYEDGTFEEIPHLDKVISLVF
jgi:energy-coupling factor transporter ATP-binding protein EcfA2